MFPDERCAFTREPVHRWFTTLAPVGPKQKPFMSEAPDPQPIRRPGRQKQLTPVQSRRVSVGLTDTEYAALEAEAEAFGKPLSEVLRAVWRGTPLEVPAVGARTAEIQRFDRRAREPKPRKVVEGEPVLPPARKAKPPQPVQQCALTVRLTIDERDILLAEAQDFHRTMGETLRAVWKGTPPAVLPPRPRTAAENVALRKLIGMSNNFNQMVRLMHRRELVSEDDIYVRVQTQLMFDALLSVLSPNVPPGSKKEAALLSNL